MKVMPLRIRGIFFIQNRKQMIYLAWCQLLCKRINRYDCIAILIRYNILTNLSSIISNYYWLPHSRYNIYLETGTIVYLYPCRLYIQLIVSVRRISNRRKIQHTSLSGSVAV